MLTVLRQRNFALLWFGQLVSVIGDWMLWVALPFYIYDLTGSALATGLMFMIVTLPRILLGSLAGVFVDRWDRKWTMIIADLLRAVVLLLLLAVRSTEWLWLIYLVAFVETSISQFFVPAVNAITPQLVGKEHLIAANSLESLNDNLSRLVGPSLGGALLGLFGLPAVVVLDTASYLVSGAMIFLISLPPAPAQEQVRPANTDATATWSALWRDWLEGLRLIKGERLVTGLFTVAGIALLGDSMITVLIVPFVEKILGVGALEFGWLLTARGVGGIAGGLVIGQVGNRLSSHRLVAASLLAAGLIFLTMINFPSFPLALVLITLLGIPSIGAFVTVQTMLQASVADEYRGRVFGAYGTTIALLMLAGMGTASVLADFLGAVPVLDLAGLLFIVSGMAALALLGKG